MDNNAYAQKMKTFKEGYIFPVIYFRKWNAHLLYKIRFCTNIDD